MSTYLGDISRLLDKIITRAEQGTEVSVEELRTVLRQLLEQVLEQYRRGGTEELRNLALRIHDYETIILSECEYVSEVGRRVRRVVADHLHVLHQFTVGLAQGPELSEDLRPHLERAVELAKTGVYSELSYCIYLFAKRILTATLGELEVWRRCVEDLRSRVVEDSPHSDFTRNCLTALSTLLELLCEVRRCGGSGEGVGESTQTSGGEERGVEG